MLHDAVGPRHFGAICMYEYEGVINLSLTKVELVSIQTYI